MPAKNKPAPKPKAGSKPQTEAVLRARVLDVAQIVHGFSTRLKPGNAAPTKERLVPGLHKNDFNLGFVDGFPREAVERNRAAFIRAVEGDGKTKWTLV
jgi:hypothetical protein